MKTTITGKDIKKARLERGLTQIALAKKLGYKSASIIQRAEKNKLSAEKMNEIANALMRPASESFTVYTDGGCLTNPNGPGGYGIVIINDHTKEEKFLSEGFKNTTNNRMEIMAAAAACENLPNGAKVKLYSDSQYLVSSMNYGWKRNKNVDLWLRLDSAIRNKHVSFFWIKSHENNHYNDICDDLAMKAYTSENLKEDIGYTSLFKRKDPANNAMSTEIHAPKEDNPVITDINVYAKEKEINTRCAQAIKEFYNSDRKFKAYKNLKTYGADAWSSRDLFTIDPEYSKWGIIHANLSDKNMAMAALRWTARGLTIRDAIRKVLVDKEIRENMQK